MVFEGDPATEPLVAPTIEARGERLAGLLGVREAGRVLRDFVTYLPTQLIPAIAGFLVLPVLARQLAPTELGVLTIAQTLITLGWIVSAQWLTSALVRELPASREAGHVGGFSATLVRGLGITGLLLGAFSAALFLASLASGAVASNLLLILAATGGLVLQNMAVSLFAASLRPRAYAVVDVLARTGGIALGVVLVFKGYKVHGYLTGIAISSALVGALGLWAGWPRAGRGVTAEPAEPQSLRTWWDFGMPLAWGAVALWGLLLIDRYLLAALRDTGAVGVYAVGAVIGDKVVFIPTIAFYTAARPLLVRAFERHGREEVERLMRAYTRITLLIGLPVVAMAAATANVVVPLLSSGAYERYYKPAAPVVPIVAVGALVFALARVGETGLVIAKRTAPLVYAAFIALVVNVVANLVLIPPLGIKGAAIATPIGYLALLASTQLYARRHATWSFPFATLLRAAAAAAIGYGVARAAMLGVDANLAKLAVAAAAGAPAYVAVVALLGERRAETASP